MPPRVNQNNYEHDYVYSEPRASKKTTPPAPPRVDENNYIFNGAPGHTLAKGNIYTQYEETLTGEPRYASADANIYTQYEDTLTAVPTSSSTEEERYSLPIQSSDWGGDYETRS